MNNYIIIVKELCKKRKIYSIIFKLHPHYLQSYGKVQKTV